MIVILLLPFIACQLPSVAEPETDRSPIVAYVGSQTITLADIDLQLGRSTSTVGSLGELPVGTRLATIHLIAQQRQSLETLKRSKAIVTAADVDRWLEMTYPTDGQQTGAEIARAKALAAGVTEASFRELLQWRLSWQKYLNQHLTSANLKKHFERQPTRFDGTRFSIEQLVIPALPGQSDQRTAARRELTQLRSQLADGKLTMRQGAEQLDSRRAADTKLEPVWISGNGPLHPAIVDAVIKLNTNEFSPVFDSPAGVHLIRLISSEPGMKKLDEVADAVRRHMLLYLLEFSANQSAEQMPLTVVPTAVK